MVSCVLLAACGGATDPSSGRSRAEAGSTTDPPAQATTTTLPARGDASDAELAAIGRVRRAVELLLDEPAVEIRYEGAVGHAEVTAAATVRNDLGTLRSSEAFASGEGDGDPITSEDVLTSDALYVRILGPRDDPDTAPWSKLEPGIIRSDLLEEIYTGQGAAGKSLPRLVGLMEAIPFEIEGSGPAPEDASPDLVRVSFRAADIADLFRATGAERVGAGEPSGVTRYAFAIDAVTGLLRGLRADGTQFHDGEAIEDVDVRLSYAPVAPQDPTAPPDKLVRSGR